MVKLGKIALIGLCLATAGLTKVYADQTTVSFDSGNQTVFNQGSTALSGGSTADGNGDVLQLGYFTGANFTGNFVVLAGAGSANGAALIPDSNGGASNEPYSSLSIGDLNGNGAGDGTFALSLDFVTGSSSGNNLPSGGTLLALRFYNTTTITPASFYNTVTSPLWAWQTPNTPPVNVTMSLDDAGLLWESIVAKGQAGTTAFHTSIAAIPEPSTLTSMIVGAGMLAGVVIRRRRR